MKVAIIGGGLAGLACAKTLVDNGVKTTLFESNKYLGGRAFSFKDTISGEVLDNSPHVILGCCKETVDFFSGIGVACNIDFVDNIRFIGPKEESLVLKESSLPAPYHLLPSLIRSNYLTPREKMALPKIFWKMKTHKENLPPDAKSYFKQMGVNERLASKLFKPIVLSALNENLDEAGSLYAAKIIEKIFGGDKTNWRMGVPKIDMFSLISKPSFLYLQDMGCNIRLGCGVRNVVFKDNGDVEGIYAYALEKFDAYVFCVMPRVLSLIGMTNLSGKKLNMHPIISVSIVFNKRQKDMAPACAYGREFGWVFVRNNVIQAVASPADELVNISEEKLIQMGKESISVCTDINEADIISERVVINHMATFSTSPYAENYRPPTKTKMKNTFLAGDWCDTGHPSTMEGAIVSGKRAAEEVLRI